MNGIEMCVDETDDMMQSIALRMATPGSGTDKVSGSKASSSNDSPRMATPGSGTDKVSGSKASSSNDSPSFPFKTWKDEVVAMKESGVCKVTDTRTIPEKLQEKQHSVVSPSEQNPREEKEEAKQKEAGEENAATDEEMPDVEHDEKFQDQEMPDAEKETEEKKDAEKKDEAEKDKAKKDEDVDLPRRRLYEGSLPMDITKLKCLIYKLDKIDQEMWNTFCLLKNFRHAAVDTLHTFYVESNQPRVVLSWLDCMLCDLVRSPENRKMFFTKIMSHQCLSTWFRTNVIDVCSGLENLFIQHLYPPKITFNDLYVYKFGQGKNHIKIKLLVLKVEKIDNESKERDRRKELWEQVRLIIEKIQKITKTDVLSKVAQRFINFIGADVKLLTHYPDTWSLAQKGRYLLSIIAADKDSICDRLETSSLKWPEDEKTGSLPHVLDKLIVYDLGRPYPSYYLPDTPYDYLRLSGTIYKHFPALYNLSVELQDVCTTRDDYIQRMETWEPEIWCILYDAIGVPDV